MKSRKSWIRLARRPASLVASILLVALPASEIAGQPSGLFQSVAPTAAAPGGGSVTPPDSPTLRRRLVSVDFGQLVPFAATAEAGGAAGPRSLRLNLFDDAVFTGLVERTAPTFSGGYALSGRLAHVEMGTVTLVVNGAVVAGTVWTQEATYLIRPAGGGLHAVSQVDPARLPRLGEPIPRRGPAYDDLPPIGPDRGTPPGHC